MGGEQPGGIEMRDVAEIESGLINGQAADGRPEIQCVAAGSAREAVIDLPGKMDGEGSLGSGSTAGNRARTAKLRTMPRSRLEADQVQDLAHRNLLSKLVIVDARHESSGRGLYAASDLEAAGGFLTRWARYDLPRIFSRMAPSTTRSKKAIANGGSPRYSVHASKSMFVTKAVEC